ncbi:TonB-dependent receptor [Phenylobacterium sp. LjRoot225]|uniref:TonB-dependent receptor n=1 Tax=Phenylobacterium sp. LjRoot225 TaxID=3342285 RepID=UPI003ED140DD
MRMNALLGSSAVLVALGTLMPVSAYAQAKDEGASQVSEVIVTAQRRSEASRDVPITITTLNQSQLAVANANQLSDITKLTPSLRFDSAGTFVQPTIRGVGTAVSTSGGGPNVGIYVDGFFQSNSQVADFQLLKVRNIQVLKGPQGTLFGRNTTGGAILVTTADPDSDPAGELKASYARFNTVTLQGYGTTGVGDKVAVDIEGVYRKGDSFKTNIVNDDHHVGKFENWSIRTGAKVQFTDSVSGLLRYTHSETDDPTLQLSNAYLDRSGQAGFFSKVSAAGQAFYGKSSSAGVPLIYFYAPTIPGSYTIDPNKIASGDKLVFTNKSDTLQATIKADLGFADLTSYTQYREDRSDNNGDLDATALPFFFIDIDIDNKTLSQEFLLNSKAGTALQWTAGVNYFQNKDIWDIGAAFGAPPFLPFGGSGTTTKSYAAFVDATYQLSEKWYFTAGGRYSHDLVTEAYFRTNFTTTAYEGPDGNPVSTAGLPPETVIPVKRLKNNSFTPRAVIRYKPNENSSLYASFTRGYKAGILNVGGLSQVPVEPEKINAYEVGYKYSDSSFSFDLASYYYDYKNLQVSSYQNGAAMITNAATSEIYGVEGQFRYRVTADFNVNGGAAWTHARYKSFRNAPYYSYCDPVAVAPSDMVCGAIGPGSLTQTTTDASGLKMQRSPSFTGNVGANYGLDLAGGRLTLSGNLYYSSSLFFDPSEQFKQKAYEILSLRAQWVDPSDRYTVAVFGDNVTNKRYQSQVLFNTLGIGSVWGSPATYGVELGAKF